VIYNDAPEAAASSDIKILDELINTPVHTYLKICHFSACASMSVLQPGTYYIMPVKVGDS